MPDVLSQNQIDKLLSNLSNNEAPIVSTPDPKTKLKPYDFKSPKKFTKERLRTIESLYESFGRALTTYFTNLSRVFCEITIIQIEEQRYFEYNNALPETCVIGIYDLQATKKTLESAILIMNLSTQLGFYMVEKLLGGSGNNCNLSRAFTEIETAILENVFSKITRYIEDSWGKYIEIEASLQSVETNPRLMQVCAPEDVLLIVSMQVVIREITGTMSICIPALNLDQLMDNFTPKFVRFNKKQDFGIAENRKQLIMNTLSNAELELKAVLDKVDLDLNDILQLKVDDIILLNKGIDEDIVVMIDNAPWSYAKLGEAKMKKAIKIIDLVDKEVKNGE